MTTPNLTDQEAEKLAKEHIADLERDDERTITMDEWLQLAHKVLELLERKRWIPVSERLPRTLNEDVLVLWTGGQIELMASHTIQDYAKPKIKHGGYITHWTPLPQPPEQP